MIPLSTRVKWFEEAEDASLDSRTKAERDRDYYDGKQLTAAELKELSRRGQPAVVINRIKRKIDFLTGSEVQTRTDPKAFPRNPNSDDQSAEAATDAIRFVADNNRYEIIRSDVWENMAIEGFGGAEVTVRRKVSRQSLNGNTTPEIDIVIKRIAWDRLFFDPHSSHRNFTDAKYKGVVIWMDAEDAILKWPKARELLEMTLASATTAETFDDRPKFNVWADAKRKRVRIVQMHYSHQGEWWMATFTKQGDLVTPGLSLYVDDEERTVCPLIMASAHVDRDNNRYGFVREMVDPQDEINKRRSKALHQVTMRQTRGDKGVVDDVRGMKQELAKPDGHVETNPVGNFEILDNNDMTAGQFTLLQQATEEIDGMGPNASLSGKQDKELSGRALLAQQQGGFMELGRAVDSRRQFDLDVYRACWDRVRQFWNQEKWVRVTDNEQNIRFVGLNRPVTEMEDRNQEFTQRAQGIQQLESEIPQLPPQEQGLASQSVAQSKMLLVQEGRAAEQRVVRVENNVGEMDVDIIVDQAPDTTSIQVEQFEIIAQMGDRIPPDLLVEMSQLRNKKEILAKMRGETPESQEAIQKQNQLAEQNAVLDLQKKEAEVGLTKAESVERMAKAEAAARPEPIPEQNVEDPLDIRLKELEIEKKIAEIDNIRAQQKEREANALNKTTEAGAEAKEAQIPLQVVMPGGNRNIRLVRDSQERLVSAEVVSE